jgi:molecular chaperone DnaK
VPQIEVTFDIDANGILNVSARDKGTGKEQRITITASSGLPKEEVEKLVQEAEAHAEEDQNRRDEVETRNIGDSLAYNADKLVRENKDKISDELQQEINEKTTSLRSALQGEDMDAIKSVISDLQESLQKVGEEVYQQQQQEAQAAAPGDGPVDDSTDGSSEQAPEESDGPSEEEKPPDDTVEGEFREV